MLSLHHLNRRRFLGLGVLGGLSALGLPRSAAGGEATRRAQAKNVLVIYEQGGLSHLDTWDPKPDALAEHRSPFRPVATRVPGMQFTELLKHTGRVADKLAVVRSMHHSQSGADAHPNGTQYALSGSHPGGPTEMPDIGSIVAQRLGTACRCLPPYVMVPGNHEQAAQTRNAFLPASTRVFKTGGRDVSDPQWKINDLRPRAENTDRRLTDRRQLLDVVDAAYLGTGTGQRPAGGMERFYDQAFDMLTNSKVAAAFDLGTEPQAVRDKYGPGHRGACYLVGRKLIEAGVRFVTVDARWPLTPETPRGGNLNWDHHDFIYAQKTCELPGASGAGAGRYGIGHWCMMGSLDQAFAALVEDLDQRGLLAETLVCFVSEFGRTPKLNKFQGRDHWTHAYALAFAGAGVPGGQVIGRSDKSGGYVTDDPHTPEDYAATIYEKLGIDRTQPLYTASHRPVYFGHGGEPIANLF
ncbi:MAG: DUF1501 domain-containing protein [Planctomycetia bacterium]|nr:DUF1501 domain-containing protein [Planctomycetia bacterium]